MTEQTVVEKLSGFHYTGGPFNGYDFLGYIGNSDRNYVTDVWVTLGAAELGWSEAELSEWMLSKDGRFALENDALTAEDFLVEMQRCDMDELMAEALEDAQ